MKLIHFSEPPIFGTLRISWLTSRGPVFLACCEVLWRIVRGSTKLTHVSDRQVLLHREIRLPKGRGWSSYPNWFRGASPALVASLLHTNALQVGAWHQQWITVDQGHPSHSLCVVGVKDRNQTGLGRGYPWDISFRVIERRA